MNYPELLLYWIKERYAILQKKEAGLPAPWSEDPVFQTTYFCNVRREDDKVTRWIRAHYSPFVNHPLFEYNMVLARLLNRIETLEAVGYEYEHDPVGIVKILQILAERGPIWGNAYVITTHGQKMDKLAYLAQVLDLVHANREVIEAMCRNVGGVVLPPTCSGAAEAFQRIPGIGSFLSAQVVADLKNTPTHPLQSAPDRATFVLPGPGSIRGLGWYHYENPDAMRATGFNDLFAIVRRDVDKSWPEGVPTIDNQDLQNCLCEFDKYCRVKTGTGRSKRKYNGKNDKDTTTK